jgi:hypothetical protein
MVFNCQQYFSYIVAVRFIGTRRESSTCHKSLTNFIAYCRVEYTSPWTGFELTILVVIGIDYTGSCKANYNHDGTAVLIIREICLLLYQSD